MGSITNSEGHKLRSVVDLDDETLRAFLEKQALANKNTLSVPMMDEIIGKQLRMNMHE